MAVSCSGIHPAEYSHYTEQCDAAPYSHKSTLQSHTKTQSEHRAHTGEFSNMEATTDVTPPEWQSPRGALIGVAGSSVDALLLPLTVDVLS